MRLQEENYLKGSAICTYDDVYKWHRRADQFRYFWQDIQYSLPHDKFAEFSHHKMNPSFSSDIGSLEALFLGEKPSVSICRPYLEESLQNFGYKISSKFYYDNEEILKMMREFRGIYSDLDRNSSHELMAFLSDQAFHDSHAEIGLALGYPLESCKTYSRKNPGVVIENIIRRCDEQMKICFEDMNLEQIIEYMFKHADELNLSEDEFRSMYKCYLSFMHDGPLNNFTRVSVYGVSWEEYGVISETSRKTQNRLRAAFELSGILDVFNPLTYNGNGKCVSRYYTTQVY